MTKILAVLVLTGITAIAKQSPLTTPAEPDSYEFGWPIKDVAIIGAGVSGLLTYQALSLSPHFHRLRLFERDTHPGGNWHHTPTTPPSIPITKGTEDDWWKVDYEPLNLSTGDIIPWKKKWVVGIDGVGQEELRRKREGFRLSKPVWDSLRANTPAPQQEIPNYPWPLPTSWATHHSTLSAYLRSFASYLHINTNDNDHNFNTNDYNHDSQTKDNNHDPNTNDYDANNGVIAYNTRVELVQKRLDDAGRQVGWRLFLREFRRVEEGVYEERVWSENFDAIVIASGRFNIPHIPAILGLAEWQERFPDNIIHSRQYRSPNALNAKNVIVVGASASATGISTDINPHVSTSYLSVREHSDDPRSPVLRAIHLNSVPKNTTIIPEIKAFLPPSGNISTSRIELINGSIISGIDHIIFGTGFRYSFPYLPQYHNSSSQQVEQRDENEQAIITDGSHVRSLYLDSFYIDNPTIAFQGQNVGIQTFVYGKYLATAIARVWSGQASLPTRKTMWASYWKTVEERGGLKKGFQWLNGENNLRMLKYFVGWLNSEALKYGGEFLSMPKDVSEEMDVWMKARLAGVQGGVTSPDGRNDFVNPGASFGEWRDVGLDDW